MLNRIDNNSNANGNNNLNNNNGRLVGIDYLLELGRLLMMNTDLYLKICSYENLEKAFQKARTGKTLKPYVVEFEQCLKENLQTLQVELFFQTYKPRPLETFILRDPKTRKISKSDFRDRIIHHAICNIIEPLFEKSFIFDSYANRIGKGTLKAIERFEHFAGIVSRGYTRPCFVLKADIRHYFETVDHAILLRVLSKKIQDQRLLWLIQVILSNHQTEKLGKGMPLGNLTSQFFANVFLNELDQFVKHKLRAKYYIRYVDDFVILDSSKERLIEYKSKINLFLREKLDLNLHPEKSKILRLEDGVGFLGLRIFPDHKRIQKRNIRRFDKKFKRLHELYKNSHIEREKVLEHFEGWLSYISHANSFKYRKHLVRMFNQLFPLEKPIQTYHIAKHQNFVKKTEEASLPFSVQKTLQLFKKGMSVEQIAEEREITVSTVWAHLANLIEYNQLSLRKVLPEEKIRKILPCITSATGSLTDIKSKVQDASISYDEINCVFSHVKSKNRTKNILYHINWYKKVHCMRKCYLNKKQRGECSVKFDLFVAGNPALKMKQDEFLDLFNNNMSICVLPRKEKLQFVSWKQFQLIKSVVIKRKKRDVTPSHSAKP